MLDKDRLWIEDLIKKAVAKAIADRRDAFKSERPSSVREFSARHGISATTTRELVTSGFLPHFRVGKLIRLLPEADKLMRENQTNQSQE